MKPKIEYKPEAKTLTEALGVPDGEVFKLCWETLQDAANGGEFMTLLWDRAPTPQHALLGAFFVGVWFMHIEGSKFKEEMDDGKDSGESSKEEG